MSKFYTQNGWEGKNYKISMGAKEVAVEVRNYIKKEFAGMGLKFNVFVEHGSSLYVCLVQAPYEQPFTKEWAEKHPAEAEFKFDCQHATCEGVLIPELHKVFDKIQSFVLSYIHDDSDGMIDYFDRNIYDHYYVGNWKSGHYKYVPLKGKETKGFENNAPIPTKIEGVQVVDYSEKAIVVVGETKPIKDSLKEMGGRWNSHLTCGAGWVFSKAKEQAVRQLLNL